MSSTFSTRMDVGGKSVPVVISLSGTATDDERLAWEILTRTVLEGNTSSFCFSQEPVRPAPKSIQRPG